MEDFSAEARDARFHNDLEAVAVSRYPEIGEHLSWLRQRGSARMTGSGGCVFAPFATREAAERVIAELPGSMQGFVARGLETHPVDELFARLA